MCVTYPDVRYLSGCVCVAMLQTSSNHPVFQGSLALIVTNVVNPSPKSAFSCVLARRLTTFVTSGVGDALKMLQIDDVCNNSREREPFAVLLRVSCWVRWRNRTLDVSVRLLMVHE